MRSSAHPIGKSTSQRSVAFFAFDATGLFESPMIGDVDLDYPMEAFQDALSGIKPKKHLQY